jgi:hypothetical protein
VLHNTAEVDSEENTIRKKKEKKEEKSGFCKQPSTKSLSFDLVRNNYLSRSKRAHNSLINGESNVYHRTLDFSSFVWN